MILKNQLVLNNLLKAKLLGMLHDNKFSLDQESKDAFHVTVRGTKDPHRPVKLANCSNIVFILRFLHILFVCSYNIYLIDMLSAQHETP